MNNEQLRMQLEQLHAELQQASALDPQREKLQARANEIEQLLKREEIKPPGLFQHIRTNALPQFFLSEHGHFATQSIVQVHQQAAFQISMPSLSIKSIFIQMPIADRCSPFSRRRPSASANG